MSTNAKARIRWLTPEEGGRKKPPIGPRYVTVVHFENDKSYPDEAWSIVVEYANEPDQSLTIIADVYFLVDEAPVKFLEPGNKFELLEGPKIVAYGEILP